jgi:Sulfotransferase domain
MRGDHRARSLQQALLESEDLRDWASRSAWTRAGEYAAVADGMTASIVRRLMGAWVASSEAHTVGDKTPLNGPGVVAEISRLLPDARVVHIIRDGRDVILSGAHHRWNRADRRPGSSAAVAAELEIRDAYRADPEGYLAAGRSIFAPGMLQIRAANWAQWTVAAAEAGRKLGPKRYAEIRYEQLAGGSGAKELLRLWTFLGAKASIGQANAAIEANGFQRLTKGRPAGAEDSAAFLRAGVAGDWQRVFTAEDRAIFERAAGDALIGLGYEEDARWSRSEDA